MNEGWIKLHRRLIDNPRFKDGDWLRVWLWMLMMATHKTHDVIFKGERITLQPGQFTAGRLQIAEETGVSQAKVWRILKNLKSEQQIEQRVSNACSLFSIVNWDRYQTSEQPSEQRLSSQRAASEQPVSTKQEGKEYKEGGEVPKPPLAMPIEDESHIPALAEFKAAFMTAGIPDAYLEKQYSWFEDNRTWLNGQGRLKNWKNLTLSRWNADRAKWKAPTPAPGKMTENMEILMVSGKL